MDVQALIAFFVVRHDPWLVLAAAFVCLLASYAGISLVHHARAATGTRRAVWIAISAVAVGTGVWATHFIAMLAFDPGFAASYEPSLTALSLAIAVSICGLGIYVAVTAEVRHHALLAGAIVGLGISTMHYLGIAAMIMGGSVIWGLGAVAASVLLGMAFGGAALWAAHVNTLRGRVTGVLALTAAICAMHFTAMAAADFSLCYPVVLDHVAVGAGPMAAIVTLAVLIILLAVLGTTMLDRSEQRRRTEEAAARLEITDMSGKLQLALTHMGQALCLYGADERLLLHNSLYGAMLGLEGQDLYGKSFAELVALTVAVQVTDAAQRQSLMDKTLADHRALIRTPGGGEVVHTLGDGRVLSVRHHPIGDGSWVTTIEDVTERRASEQRIAHLARHDALTGLPNRATLIEAVDNAIVRADRNEGRFAILFLDLDGLGSVNDTYGHRVGDAVLKAFAERLDSGLDDGEMVARVGGDEFMALKPLASIDELRGFVDAVEADLVIPVEADGKTIALSAKMGIALYPDDALDRDKLLANAELALNRAKSTLDTPVCYYEADMDEFARRRREMIADLWAAVEGRQFFLNYQVQKSIPTGEVTGYEVLVRWMHPVKGLVSPGDFIPLAEECGAINDIGAWVLEAACRDAAGWRSPARVAVNLSPVQLTNRRLPQQIAQILVQTGLSPNRLELEVTESAIIADKATALHLLRQIKALGIAIAIDDFGTGYSSLETLRAFPFDKIKLDRSFVADLGTSTQSRAFVRAILALGNSLGTTVLAEGVETQAQLAVLAAEGCAEAQGYYFGRPEAEPEAMAPRFAIG